MGRGEHTLSLPVKLSTQMFWTIDDMFNNAEFYLERGR